jgi:hypothetical protein
MEPGSEKKKRQVLLDAGGLRVGNTRKRFAAWSVKAANSRFNASGMTTNIVNASEKILELSKRLAEIGGQNPLESEFYQRSARALQEAKESLESSYADAIRECIGL